MRNLWINVSAVDGTAGWKTDVQRWKGRFYAALP